MEFPQDGQRQPRSAERCSARQIRLCRRGPPRSLRVGKIDGEAVLACVFRAGDLAHLLFHCGLTQFRGRVKKPGMLGQRIAVRHPGDEIRKLAGLQWRFGRRVPR